MSDCKITCLPEEVIDIILSYNDITMEDIINFRRVCKQFRYAAKYDKFLEKKLSQRWPYAKKKYESFKEKENGENINFVTLGINSKKTIDKENVNFVTKGIKSVIELRNYLSQILFYDYYYNNKSNKNYFDDSIDNIVKFDDVMKFSNNINKYVKNLDEMQFVPKRHRLLIEMKCMFYIEEIKYLLTQSPQIDRKSIERYCNIEMAHYVKLSLIRNELDRYIEKPETKQLLEETCTFVAKYIQVRKDVCFTNVSASLDTIAQEVLNRLRVKHPNHSIFSTSDETFSYWKTNNIEDNHWDETESTQIMDTLQEYIFGTLKFRTCISLPEDIKYLCIDYVLQNKYGQDIIVCTIFHSVARRLGLRCDIIVIWPYFRIFWKPKFVTSSLKNARCFHINDENFPNCLINHLPESMIYTNIPRYIAITPRQMLMEINNIVIQFIMNHKIKALRLIRVNCSMLSKYADYQSHISI